jgi:uncharacterized membrane protein
VLKKGERCSLFFCDCTNLRHRPFNRVMTCCVSNGAFPMTRLSAPNHIVMLGTWLLALAASACTDSTPTAPVTATRPAVFAQSAGGAGPKVTDLGTLGGRTSKANSLNTPKVGNRLLIVGSSNDKAGMSHAAYWYVDVTTGARQSGALPAPPGDAQSGASSVNQAEAIVGGSATTVGGLGRPVRWAAGGWSPSFLNLAGNASGGAFTITESGLVVGSIANQGYSQAAFWEGSNPTILPGLGVDADFIEDANAAGVMVGIAKYTLSSSQRAVMWQGGSITPLPDGGYNSFALGINDAGVIVGMNFTQGTPAPRAVRWLPPTVSGGPYTMEDLGITGDAYGINNVGEIVGYDNAGGAFYWFNGQPKKLPPLAAGLRAGAQAINENGDVVGWGYDHSQSQHAVLWTHVR